MIKWFKDIIKVPDLCLLWKALKADWKECREKNTNKIPSEITCCSTWLSPASSKTWPYAEGQLADCTLRQSCCSLLICITGNLQPFANSFRLAEGKFNNACWNPHIQQWKQLIHPFPALGHPTLAAFLLLTSYFPIINAGVYLIQPKKKNT